MIFHPGTKRQYRIVCQGDSITKDTALIPSGPWWPEYMATILGSDVREVINAGIGGKTTNYLSALAPAGDSYLLTHDKTIVFCWEIGNSIRFDVGMTARQAVDDFKAWVLKYRSVGCKVVIANLWPRADWTAPQQVTADQVNLILDDEWRSFSDRLSEMRPTERAKLGLLPIALFPDGVHPLESGHQIIAQDHATIARSIMATF
jgi:lysophospholipase L1-like esterase